MNRFLLLGILIGLFSSCTIKTTTAPLFAPPKNAAEIIERTSSKNNDFQWLSIKGRASIVKKDQNIALSINIKNRKDSIIWISARGPFGVEIIRIQLTPDSIYVINRVNKTYLKKPASEIKAFINPCLSFNEIQDMISGNLKVFGKNYRAEEQEGGFYLDSDNRSYSISNNYRIKSIKLVDKNNTLEIYLSDFEEDGIAKKLILKAESGGGFQISINYTKVEFDKPQKILFDAPESYHEIK